MINIPVEVSARHIHLSREDFETLFGSGRALSVLRHISQPRQFAANETVILKGSKFQIENVRIVGPFRTRTQVELAVSDCRVLGIDPYFTISGDLDKSPGGISIVGPMGQLDLASGVIVPVPHLHASPPQAEEFSVKHLDRVTVTIGGERTISFHDVVVRSRDGIDELAFHINVDEANAIGPLENAKVILKI